MNHKDPAVLQEELAKLSMNSASAREIAFDKNTGELSVVEKGTSSPDATVMTEVVKTAWACR